MMRFTHMQNFNGLRHQFLLYVAYRGRSFSIRIWREVPGFPFRVASGWDFDIGVTR